MCARQCCRIVDSRCGFVTERSTCSTMCRGTCVSSIYPALQVVGGITIQSTRARDSGVFKWSVIRVPGDWQALRDTESRLAIPAFNEWPIPESQALRDIVDAIRARSRSLNHRTSDFTIDVTTETRDGIQRERLDLQLLTPLPDGNRFSLTIWGDLAIWLDVRRWAKNGWTFAFTRYGQCDGVPSEELRDMVECSLAGNDDRDLLKIWCRCRLYTE